MTDSITSKKWRDALSEQIPLRRRDLLQGAAIGAAAIATVSSQETRAEAANTDCGQLSESQHRDVPSDYDEVYVKNVIIPFLRTSIYEGERPALPMIDVILSKDMALPKNLVGLLYDEWQPDPEAVGLTVFIQALEKRGSNNLRKKIYVSAVTPDLYALMYAGKVKAFFDRWLDDSNAVQPLMTHYNDGYFDLYWDLHLGVKGEDVPKVVREFGTSFNTALAYQDPRQRIVYENYMKVRELRSPVNAWIADRLKDIANGKTPGSEKTIAHYWIKNGEQTDHFREKDIAFECFHNLVAMSQWGVALYRFIEKLEEDHGDPAIRAAFKRTMESDYDNSIGTAFTPLDRFVMELFRKIPLNPGSISSVKNILPSPNNNNGLIRTPHVSTNLDPRHWENPDEFNPDRYLSAPASNKVDKGRARELGFATCPFESTPFHVKDGRKAEVTNSAFGAVYGVVDGNALPVCDYAGYAPFGFGYRRCAGELLTINIFKDFFRKVWKEKIIFQKLKGTPKRIPVGAGLLTDDIGFSRRRA